MAAARNAVSMMMRPGVHAADPMPIAGQIRLLSSLTPSGRASISRKSSAASPSGATAWATQLHGLQPYVPNLNDLFGVGAGRELLGAAICHLARPACRG